MLNVAYESFEHHNTFVRGIIINSGRKTTKSKIEQDVNLFLWL